jgi:hypothetical protein
VSQFLGAGETPHGHHYFSTLRVDLQCFGDLIRCTFLLCVGNPKTDHADSRAS